MKTKEVIKYFGTVKKVAEFLKIHTKNVYQWGEYPPEARQYELEVKTKRDLRVSK